MLRRVVLSVRSCQESQLLAILLCEADNALHLLVVNTKLLAEVLDNLGVQRNGLAAQLVEVLFPYSIPDHDNQR